MLLKTISGFHSVIFIVVCLILSASVTRSLFINENADAKMDQSNKPAYLTEINAAGTTSEVEHLAAFKVVANFDAEPTMAIPVDGGNKTIFAAVRHPRTHSIFDTNDDSVRGMPLAFALKAPISSDRSSSGDQEAVESGLRESWMMPGGIGRPGFRRLGLGGIGGKRNPGDGKPGMMMRQNKQGFLPGPRRGGPQVGVSRGNINHRHGINRGRFPYPPGRFPGFGQNQLLRPGQPRLGRIPQHLRPSLGGLNNAGARPFSHNKNLGPDELLMESVDRMETLSYGGGVGVGGLSKTSLSSGIPISVTTQLSLATSNWTSLSTRDAQTRKSTAARAEIDGSISDAFTVMDIQRSLIQDKLCDLHILASLHNFTVPIIDADMLPDYSFILHDMSVPESLTLASLLASHEQQMIIGVTSTAGDHNSVHAVSPERKRGIYPRHPLANTVTPAWVQDANRLARDVIMGMDFTARKSSPITGSNNALQGRQLSKSDKAWRNLAVQRTLCDLYRYGLHSRSRVAVSLMPTVRASRFCNDVMLF